MIRLSHDQALVICDLTKDLRQAIKDQGANTPPILDMALDISEQITAQLHAPAHAGDLVDTMAEILNQLPPGAVLSGVRLAQLKAAILSPLELAKVKEKHYTMACSACGAELANGSLMTQWNGTARCIACMSPDSMHTLCVGHNKIIELPDVVRKRLRTLFKNAECPTCMAPPKVAVQAEANAYLQVEAPPPTPPWEEWPRPVFRAPAPRPLGGAPIGDPARVPRAGWQATPPPHVFPGERVPPQAVEAPFGADELTIERMLRAEREAEIHRTRIEPLWIDEAEPDEP